MQLPLSAFLITMSLFFFNSSGMRSPYTPHSMSVNRLELKNMLQHQYTTALPNTTGLYTSALSYRLPQHYARVQQDDAAEIQHCDWLVGLQKKRAVAM